MPQEIVFVFSFFSFFNIPKETLIFSFIQLEEKTADYKSRTITTILCS